LKAIAKAKLDSQVPPDLETCGTIKKQRYNWETRGALVGRQLSLFLFTLIFLK
jgi:hypothetical protein